MKIKGLISVHNHFALTGKTFYRIIDWTYEFLLKIANDVYCVKCNNIYNAKVPCGRDKYIFYMKILIYDLVVYIYIKVIYIYKLSLRDQQIKYIYIDTFLYLKLLSRVSSLKWLWRITGMIGHGHI